MSGARVESVSDCIIRLIQHVVEGAGVDDALELEAETVHVQAKQAVDAGRLGPGLHHLIAEEEKCARQRNKDHANHHPRHQRRPAALLAARFPHLLAVKLMWGRLGGRLFGKVGRLHEPGLSAARALNSPPTFTDC